MIFRYLRSRFSVCGCVLIFTGLGLAGLVQAENSQPKTQPKTQPSRQLLWLQGAPGAMGDDPQQDQPAITVYRPAPETNTGTAVIICPGGGYGNLAMGHEGTEIAEWLNSLGVTAVVLEYRMGRGGYRHPVPLLDAQRAIRTVRARADEWKIDPARIGILGFSAGGHLASTAGTHFDNGRDDANDAINRESSRPDFMVLCYPVIAFGEEYTHKGSQRNLLGKTPSPELINELSNQKQVTSATPPTFLFHANEDTVVPPENSIQFYLALRKSKVPAELHIYGKGGHGFGLGKKLSSASDWPNACEKWMASQALLEANLPSEVKED